MLYNFYVGIGYCAQCQNTNMNGFQNTHSLNKHEWVTNGGNGSRFFKGRRCRWVTMEEIAQPYTPERWVLFTGDGPGKARELLKFLLVQVCVLGEMGVVAVVIVVVTVFVLWLTLILLTEGSDHFTRMGPTKK